MFQLSFLNTGLLFLAAATVLPLIIWLLAKKRPPRVIFSTIRFIKKTEKEQKNRTQIKNILLLIIRMLIILSVVLAAGRPALQIKGLKPSGKHPPTAVAIILDTSYSMDYTAGSRSSLELAKAAVAEINRKLTPQDMTCLITSDESWNRMNSHLQAGRIPDDVLGSVRSSWLPLSFDKMLEQAKNKLQESQYTNREVYYISDGQSGKLPEKLDLPVIVIPLAKPLPWDNISCSNAKPVLQLINKQQTQMIQFEIINHGNSMRRDVLVRVDLNGVKSAEKFISLQPGQKLTESLPVQISASGWQSGFVEVLDEKLAADNRSWFSFNLDLHPRIGVISARSRLPLVLNTITSVYATPQGAVNLLNPNEISFQQLKNYSLLVVYAPGELSPRLREVLQTCNKAGKGVLYCADEELSAGWRAFYTQMFGLQLAKFNRSAVPISYVNPYHTITSLLDTKQLKRTSAADFWQAPNAGSSAVLLASESNPLAVTKDNAVFWLFDPAGLNTRFFLDSGFPVFAFRSMQYLTNAQFDNEQYVVGNLLTADELTLPGGEKKELNGSSFLTYEPGIYTALWRGAEPQMISVQPDYAESSYQPQVYPKDKNYHFLKGNWQEQLFLSRLGHDLWKYLLLFALFLLALEMLLVKTEEWKKVRE